MALIWAESFKDDRAIAPHWLRVVETKKRAEDRSLSHAERGQALEEHEDAVAEYDALVSKAESYFENEANAGNPKTHALIIGVGRYQNGIKEVTTSVHGARTFAEWMLTKFYHPERPLASIEYLESSPDDLGDWIVEDPVASQMGLASPRATLPGEPATFENIENAFERWLKRSGFHLENAAFFYFSGHGVWKAKAFLLAEDAQLPDDNQQSAKNLIDIQQTEVNLFNAPPSIQCFFIDACQDIPLALLQNLAPNPGDALKKPANAPALAQRDAHLYFGSHIAQEAFGPENDAPFFTQELMACLEHRAAAEVLDENSDLWVVRTDSLWSD
ncbi:MAG: caspase family protein, partial [Planctomycetaceae bacterium]|nr:caspase family protein [Planctomycetaceae bacterium]